MAHHSTTLPQLLKLAPRHGFKALPGAATGGAGGAA